MALAAVNFGRMHVNVFVKTKYILV